MNAKHVSRKTSEASPSGNWRPRVLFAVLVVSVIALDQVTKHWVRTNIPPLEITPLIGPVSLCHVCNPGSAFGILARQSVLITLAAIAGLAAILLLSRYFRRSDKLGSIALALVFGGAAGNLIDRFCFGCVTDFVDMRLWGNFHWPAFNVADSAITVGVIALLAFMFRELRKGDDSA